MTGPCGQFPKNGDIGVRPEGRAEQIATFRDVDLSGRVIYRVNRRRCGLGLLRPSGSVENYEPIFFASGWWRDQSAGGNSTGQNG